MITLNNSTVEAIRKEMESIPEKYQKPFNSVHEGLAVLREEYVELENEVFFGEKKAKQHHYTKVDLPGGGVAISTVIDHNIIWKQQIKHEAIQVAAMAARIIQELT